jgi:REP element-mobilizing transposase RayT
VIIRSRRLPHLDVIGHPQFITFRLHGSLPANRTFHGSTLPSGAAFIAMDRLLDQSRIGSVFLRHPEIAQILVASLEHGVEIGHYDLHRWVILPNHVHLLITPHVHLPQLLRRLKTWTARQSNVILGRAGCPFWQDESYDRLVRSQNEFRRIVLYIDNNPVAAGLCATPEEYPWSSAGRAGSPPQASGLPHMA